MTATCLLWRVLPQVDNDQELFMVYRKEGACSVPRQLLGWIRHACAPPVRLAPISLPLLPAVPAQVGMANGRTLRSGWRPRLAMPQYDVSCALQ